MSTSDHKQSAKGAPLGPGSLLWATAGDPRCLLTGSTAGIMQLMLPGLGAGVTDHSDFFNDPADRINRSIPAIWGTIFADDEDEGDQRGHAIRDFHPDIKGTDHNGNRYHALDPEIFWWAHATFTWEMLRARELYFPSRRSRADQEQLYAESVTWYRRYGVSDRPVPATLDLFEQRFEHICEHELELTPAVSWVLDGRANPASGADPVSLPGPLRHLDGVATHAIGEVLRRMVYGAMPDLVRRRFGFSWTHRDRVAFAAFAGTMRGTGPAIARGAFAELWPEGTPHLTPGSGSGGEVMIAGPNMAQRRAAEAKAAGAAKATT